MTDPTPTPEPKKTDEPASKPTEGEPLGNAGKKAIDAEREARKVAEANLSALKGEFETFKTSLAEAFGVKSAMGNNDDTLVTVQRQLAAIQHESAVLRVANENNITDANDLELLNSATEPEAMQKLAARLAAKADDGETLRPRPRADLTQGGNGKPLALNSDGLEDALRTKLGIA